VERWLARLSASPYAADFVLKGGMLLAAYDARRPTADVDALARGLVNDQDAVLGRIADIAGQPDNDGVEFLTGTAVARPIREDAFYPGVRVAMDSRIATAVRFRLDINFGDPVTPAPRMIELPSLRPDTAPVRVLGYPIETVLAEKLATAIMLGAANTRVRDYADIYTLTGRHDLTRGAVRAAPTRPLGSATSKSRRCHRSSTTSSSCGEQTYRVPDRARRGRRRSALRLRRGRRRGGDVRRPARPPDRRRALARG